MALRTRKPTGEVPFPLVLVEGPEKCGKTWRCLEFTGDDRVGRCWALDLGEGTMDEYGAIPGANFEIVVHDGTWPDIIEQLREAKTEAEKDHRAGEPPAVLIVDSGTAEWDMLKDWASARAKRSPNNAALLRRNPDAEIKPGRNLWNDAEKRHKEFLWDILMAFPGIVLITARGKEISATGADGQPIAGQKDYRVEGHKNLGYDANVWVRLSRQVPPIIVGMRSVKHGIQPGIDEPKPWPEFDLGKLIFDVLGCKATSKVRDVPRLDADQVMPGEEPPPAEGEVQSGPPRDVSRPVTALLTATKAQQVEWWTTKVADNGDGNIDVTSLVPDDDKDTLGIAHDARVTLGSLCASVSDYWEKRKFGPRMDPSAESSGDETQAVAS